MTKISRAGIRTACGVLTSAVVGLAGVSLVYMLATDYLRTWLDAEIDARASSIAADAQGQILSSLGAREIQGHKCTGENDMPEFQAALDAAEKLPSPKILYIDGGCFDLGRMDKVRWPEDVSVIGNFADLPKFYVDGPVVFGPGPRLGANLYFLDVGADDTHDKSAATETAITAVVSGLPPPIQDWRIVCQGASCSQPDLEHDHDTTSHWP